MSEATPQAGRDATAATGERAAATPWPGLAVRGLQLAALWALAVVQPLFDVVDDDAAFFVARGNTAGDILILSIGLVVLPPLAMTLVEGLAGAVWRPAGRLAHLALIALLTGVLALQLLKGPLPNDSALLMPLALAVGVLLAIAYARAQGARTFLTILTPAPLVFLGLFLLVSPVSSIVFPEKGAGAVAQAAGNDTPVVLVIFDEVPVSMLMDGSERIDAARFPSFARLARTSTWYRGNTTVADGTFVAVPAILTGERPGEKIDPGRRFKNSVFTMLAGTHEVHSVEPVTRVCPDSICKRRASGSVRSRLSSLVHDLTIVSGRITLPADLADRLPAVDTDFEGFDNADDVQIGEKDASSAGRRVSLAGRPIVGSSLSNQRLREIATQVKGMRQRSRPPFYMLHIELPHVPWRFLPTGDQYPTEGPKIVGLNDQTWTRDTYQTGLGLQRFLLQARYMDRVLGAIRSQMQRTGLWDRSLVIVTADHGVSFRAGDSRRPVTPTNFADIANTPLFVKLPHQHDGAISDAPTESVDIAPTIAKVTGTGAGMRFDGVPLGDPPGERTPAVRNGRRSKFVSVSAAQLASQRASWVRTQTARFAPGNESLYRFGPNASLIGRRVPAGGRLGAPRASIDNAGFYTRIRPGSGVLPAYLTGRIAAPGVPLAAAVNGRIVAVGRSYRTPQGTRYSIVLPPSALKRGSNRVQLFAVGAGRRLTLVGSAGR